MRVRLLNGQKYYKKPLAKCSLSWIIIASILTFVVLFSIYSTFLSESALEQRRIAQLNIHLPNDVWLPNAGDNETAWATAIVPDIVHYILFEQHRISYVHMLSLFSVIRIHRPKLIYIHCDCRHMDDANDVNWQRVLKLINATNDIVLMINEIERPSEIYGRPIQKKFLNFHASDIMRYRTMRKYGGVYLDNDVFVTQPLHKFRHYEFTLNWETNEPLGTQVLIGHKNARFLKMVMETYRLYDTTQWYYNAGALPTKAILDRFPELVHRVRQQFGIDAPKACKYFYLDYQPDWQHDYYTFHMLARGDAITNTWKHYCLGQKDHFMKHIRFSDEAFTAMNTTFGEMARYVLFGDKKLLTVTRTAAAAMPGSNMATRTAASSAPTSNIDTFYS